MNIAIYHPNMHLMGGGETVALTMASFLKEEHKVTIFITKKINPKRLENFFGLDLSRIKFKVFGRCITALPSLYTLKPSMYARCAYKRLNAYDLVIDTCSNGLFEKKVGKKSICYVHYPNFSAQKHGWKSFMNPCLIKKENMFAYDTILCNSKFTQDAVKKLTKQKTHVVYPPVKTEHLTPKKKKNIIVTIGRYSPEKKLEVLIDAYIKGNFKHLEFHIIGATGDSSYKEQLEAHAQGHNIVFHENMPHTKVLSFLESAKFYWHARGYGETDPVEYENFGITTVEAIAAGCIPIVINLGAQPEIIQATGTGYTWDSPKELIAKTKSAKLTKAIIPYSVNKFSKKIMEHINDRKNKTHIEK